MYHTYIIMPGLTTRAYLQDCSFLNKLINSVISVIQSCGAPIVKKETKTLAGAGLEYATSATNTDVITLSIDGFILYLYYKAYGESYPEVPSAGDIVKLHEIYDALKIPRPL